MNRKVEKVILEKDMKAGRYSLKAVFALGVTAVLTALAASEYFIARNEKKNIKEEEEFEEFVKAVKGEEEEYKA